MNKMPSNCNAKNANKPKCPGKMTCASANPCAKKPHFGIEVNMPNQFKRDLEICGDLKVNGKIVKCCDDDCCDCCDGCDC